MSMDERTDGGTEGRMALPPARRSHRKRPSQCLFFYYAMRRMSKATKGQRRRWRRQGRRPSLLTRQLHHLLTYSLPYYLAFFVFFMFELKSRGLSIFFSFPLLPPFFLAFHSFWVDLVLSPPPSPPSYFSFLHILIQLLGSFFVIQWSWWYQKLFGPTTSLGFLIVKSFLPSTFKYHGFGCQHPIDLRIAS